MLITALTRTLGQAFDPTFRAVTIKSVLIALLIYALLTALFVWLVPESAVFDADGWFAWLNDVIDVGGTILFVAVLVVLFTSAASIISTLFLDDIADAVERRHYPNTPQARDVPLGEALAVSLKFTLISLLLNILVLPFYLLALIFPPLFVIIFYGLNGYLLSREYFELVSLRHMQQSQVKGIRKVNRRPVFFTGVIIAFATTVPILNLFVPILATALMLHVFQNVHGAKGRD